MKRYILTAIAALACSAPAFGQCVDGKCSLRARVAVSDTPIATLLAAPVVVAKEVVAAPVHVAVATTRTVVTTVTTRKPVRTALRGLRARICR